MTSDDLKDLEDLVNSKGWALLTGHIEAEWGAAGFGEKIARTLGSLDLDLSVKVSQLEQATVAQRAVREMAGWPAAQIAQHKDRATIAQMVLPRRGML